MNSQKQSRAERLKNKIRQLGSTVKMDSYTKEITIRHPEWKTEGCVRYIPGDRASIEEGLEEALKIAENFALYSRMAPSRQLELGFGGES